MNDPATAAFRFILALSLLGFSAISASGQRTIHVPGDAVTIQAGIDAASNGDTVLVAPGNYIENINFNGKSITVTSSGGAAATVINGNAAGVVVTFSSGEGRRSVINGFTIEGPVPTDDSIAGGYDGILVVTSNPTITNNIITENRGYGIHLDSASAYISGNTISYTKTAYRPINDYGCDYDDGVGIFIQGSGFLSTPPVIDHNTIEYNVGHCTGGGIELAAAPVTTVISNNTIAHNQSLGFGGGVFVENGSVSLIQNLIYDNVSGVAGGGVYLSVPQAQNESTGALNVYITNNTIYGNSIHLNPLIHDAWVDGSQVALPGYVSQIGFFNNLIIANDPYAAVACWSMYSYLSGQPPVVINSDVLNTGGAAYGGWCTMPAGSTGNISVDPKFTNPSTGDFHLTAGSPAIDAGFNAAPGILTIDTSGSPRIQNGTGASEPVVDMGVYESTGTPESRFASETTLTAQPSTIYYGQTVNLSTSVTDSAATPISPGTVSVLDYWSMIQQQTLNDSDITTGSTGSFAVGTHWLISSFGGNSSYQPSISAPVEVQVKGFTTTTSLTLSPNPANYGEPETMTASVALAPGNPTGTGTPTGSIAFYESNPSETVLATVPVNASGTATYTISSLPLGTTYIQALYQPSGGFLASNSQNLPLQVWTSAVPTVSVSGLSNAITKAQDLHVFVTVGGPPGNPTPTGSITLTSGTYSSSAVSLIAGQASVVVPAGSLSVGMDSLTVKYSGDSLYSAVNWTGVVDVLGTC